MKTNPPTREIRVQIDSRFELIELVQRLADDVCRTAGLGRDATMNIGLAIREAVANAIKHGNRLEAEKQVSVVFRLGPRKVMVAVRDQGAGFDLNEVEDPLDPGNLFKSDGRGIFFMKSFVDDVAFSRLRGGGMEVRMEKRIQKRACGWQDAANAARREGGEVG